MFSRAMNLPPIAACSATSNWCRGISLRSCFRILRPRDFGLVLVCQEGQGIDLFAAHQDPHLDQVGGFEAFDFVVHRAESARQRFQVVVGSRR